MKYVYVVKLYKGSIAKSVLIIQDICSNYIRAMEAAKDVMKFAETYNGVCTSCFNEILNVDGWFRKDQGYVRAWKAITDDIYVVHIYKTKLDKSFIKKWL